MNFKCTKSSKSVVQSFFLLFFANARADRNRRNDFSKTLGVENNSMIFKQEIPIYHRD